MLAPVLNRRLPAIALALLLLLTQHLGLQHWLGHALQGGQARVGQARAAPALDHVAGDATNVAASVATTPAKSDAAGAVAADTADEAADGLCRICLLLATLGVAALPALLQWRAQLRSQAVRLATRLRQWAAPALAGYQARAPPRFLLS